uniref:Amidohydrolase-related domain-containing protein n=1 Tax=Sinocyclocheilus rhinocerous TaxID=307959 RepID=A0A673FP28_9TELE
MIPYTVNIKLAARTLTGTLNLQNKTAVDWGWQGLIAQGCHSDILIIDPKTAQTIQVLERHKASVVKVGFKCLFTHCHTVTQHCSVDQNRKLNSRHVLSLVNLL